MYDILNEYPSTVYVLYHLILKNTLQPREHNSISLKSSSLMLEKISYDKQFTEKAQISVSAF